MRAVRHWHWDIMHRAAVQVQDIIQIQAQDQPQADQVAADLDTAMPLVLDQQAQEF